MYNYGKENIIVNFIIQKLKSKHTSPKKYTNWAKLINPANTYKFQLKTTLVWGRNQVKRTVHVALPQTAHKLVLTGSAKANYPNKYTVPILSIASQE